MGLVTSITNTLFKDARGNIHIGKTLLVCSVGAVAFPVGLSLLMITWPAGPIALAGVAAAGLTVSALKQGGEKDDIVSPSRVFGAPTAEEKKQEKVAAKGQRSYVNFRTLVPKISEQYRQELLGQFTPTQLGFKYTDDQKLERLSDETTAAAKDQFWRIARDQWNAFTELGNYQTKKVPANYWDNNTNTTKSAMVDYGWVVAAQRGALLDMIAIDRDANMMPLAQYSGETKKEDLKRSRFTEDKIFEAASRMRENGDWAQNTPAATELAKLFYNYSVSKLANLINEDKANSFEKIFTAGTVQDAFANCQIYSDACKWGLIDRQTRVAIAQRAEQVGQETGNYAFYNFCMYCLADEECLKKSSPIYRRVVGDFKTGADTFMSELRANKTSFSLQNKIGNYDTLLTQETEKNDSITARIDAVKKEATKEAFGLGTQGLATNIAALQGLAQGIEDEVFLGKYGWDKIKIALQDPKTRIFVAQGIARTAIGYIKSIGDMQRR